MKTLKKKGFTLIEIIVTLFIIVILSAIIVPTIASSIERSRESVDLANVRTLNHASAVYRLVEAINEPDTFYDLDTDEDRQDRLANLGYIVAPIEPKSSLNSIEWDVSKQRWVYSKFITSTLQQVSYVFDGNFDSVQFDQLLKGRDRNSPNNTWITTADGLRGTQGSLFFENANNSYVIEATVKMATVSTTGGIGIYVETSLSEDGSLYRDTGYVVQLDRGFANGKLVIRTRDNSVEGNPPVDHTYDGVENRNTNPDWWTQDRVVRIEVRQDPNNTSKKIMDVYVDGVKSIDGLSIDANPDPSQNFTGVRAWNQPSLITNLEIQELP